MGRGDPGAVRIPLRSAPALRLDHAQWRERVAAMADALRAPYPVEVERQVSSMPTPPRFLTYTYEGTTGWGAAEAVGLPRTLLSHALASLRLPEGLVLCDLYQEELERQYIRVDVVPVVDLPSDDGRPRRLWSAQVERILQRPEVLSIAPSRVYGTRHPADRFMVLWWHAQGGNTVINWRGAADHGALTRLFADAVPSDGAFLRLFDLAGDENAPPLPLHFRVSATIDGTVHEESE